MSKCLRIYAIVLAAAVLLTIGRATPLWSQAVANAQISGSVTDPSGAAVPGAKVTATQTNTRMARTTTTGADGTYLFANLPVGPYLLEAGSAGFETYVQKGIVLQVSDSPVINITLKVGQVTQQVEVSAGATMVQTQTTSVSQVVDERSVVDLPLNGRNPVQLAILAGAANTVAPANFTGSKEYPSALEVSVAGGQANGTNYLMDGGDNNDAFANVNLPFPFPDALQEFSVQTNSLPARYGVHPGAVVNMVTKSGTNLIHGDLFEFVRNGDADARNFFAAKQDTLRRNQFGGTIGGPIKKDKLFGFFGYQGTRTRTAPASSIAFVPTQAVMTGDWSAWESAGCNSKGARTITNPATGQPYANDAVSPSTYNQQALNLLKYLPVSSNPCGQLNYAIPAPSGENQYIGRADWTLSSKHNLFGRYFLSNYDAPPQYGGNGLLTTQYGVLDRVQSTVLGDTYSFSPTIVNSAHATWSRLAIHRQADPSWINPTDLGVNMYSYLTNALYLTVGSDFSVGCSTCPASYFVNNTGQISDDLDILRGHHHISLGADVIRQQLNFSIGGKGDGIFSFSTQFSGDPMLDFLLGMPNSFTQAAPTVTNMRQLYLGAYVSDNYQVTKRFNIQVGLRWEPYLSPRDIHNDSAAWFSQAAYDAGTTSKVFVNAPPGVFYTGDAGYPQNGRTFGKFTPPQPRVGIVWDPTGSGKQTIRAGYGLFYDMTMTFYYATGSSDAPWASQVTIANPTGGFTNPYQGFSGGNPFPLPAPSAHVTFPPLLTWAFLPANFSPQNTQQWDLSYENQITPNWLVSATFIGNKSTDISVGNNLNPAVYIPGTCGTGPCSTLANTQSRRVLSLINPTAGNLFSSVVSPINANAEYSGLLLSAKHRFSKNYTFLANYTWSHCIDEGDFAGAPGATFQNTANAFADRGNCGFDLRHIANLSFTANSPKFAGQWTDRLLGNWQLAPILAVHSGTWFTPTMGGVDNSLTSNGLDRPNSASGVDSYAKNMSTLQWLNPAAFTANATGTFGTAGMSSLAGPGYFDVDASVSRYFPVPRHENQRFELRFEFFNLFNHANFAVPNSTETSSKFGQIQSAADPRILEFAMKYSF